MEANKLEEELLAKFASEDNFLISLRLGKGIDWLEIQEVIDKICSLKNDSPVVSKELEMLFIDIPRILNGGLGLYEGSERQEILLVKSKLYAAMSSCLSV